MERNDMILYFDIPEFSESLYCPWWKPGYVIPQAGDNIRLENLLPEEQLALLELVPSVKSGRTWKNVTRPCGGW